MKKIILLVALAFSSLGYAQDVSVTLSVDMNAYCGAPITTLYVSGTFNSWSGDANPMTDDNADGVYDVTLTLPAGTDSILYKFQANQWAIQESFSPGDPCTITADGFTNRVLLFDGDITVPAVCWNSCSACVLSGLEQIELDIDWEGDLVDYSVSDFGENSSTLDVDPTNSGNTVLKTDRSPTAPTWAGTTLSTPCGFAQPIAFDINNNIITVNVYSPVAGAIIRLKAEDHLDPTHSVETDATITAANTWETLTFDFTNEATGTAAINYTYTFDMLSIFYNFGVDGATAGAQTYYCDDIVFVGGGVVTSHDVTFKVDMNNFSGAFSEVQLNGTFNGWCGACNPMSDIDADGIWEVTLPIEGSSIEYKFTFDNWTGQENLVEGLPCTVTNSGFTNRYLEISTDTILPVVCWESCLSCAETPLDVDVNFKVDMSNYTDPFTSVYVSGTFNNWCGDCNMLTDVNLDGVYETTLQLSTDTIQYKFTIDNWAVQEEFIVGESCTSTIDGFTNREAIITESVILPLVCWNSCISCSGLAQIDLPISWEGDEVDYTVTDFGENTSVLIADPAGGSNMVLQSIKGATAPTWSGTTLSTPSGLASYMPFDIDNNIITVKVYSPDAGIVVRLKAEDHNDPTHSVETDALTTTSNEWETLTFDFTNEAAGTAEINYSYNFDMLSIFYNFGVDGATAGEKTYYCDDIIFGGGVIPSTSDVTFKVDMNEYTGDFTEIQLNGTFNGWCGSCNPMTDDDADGVWEVTLPLEDGTIEYKYTFDNWTGQESLSPDLSCTITTDGFTNRILEISGDTILPAVCWEYCVSCLSLDIVENNIFEQIVIAPNPSKGIFKINGELSSTTTALINIMDIQGKIIYQSKVMGNSLNETIDLSDLENGMYFINVSSELGSITEKILILK